MRPFYPTAGRSRRFAAILLLLCLLLTACSSSGSAGSSLADNSDPASSAAGGSGQVSSSEAGSEAAAADEKVSGRAKLKVMTTIFAAYDLAKEAGGDLADVTLLLKPGSEAHSYEPTPKDMIAISECDIFICTGGENDAWVDTLLEGLDNASFYIIRMTDCVGTALEEESTEGMQSEEGVLSSLLGGSSDESADESEWDEHVWMSPDNAGLIVGAIAEAYAALDPGNSAAYRTLAANCQEKLTELDSEFRTLIEGACRREIIFADRFPARYFTEEYGLSYYAAFPGCSENAEASAATVSFLIRKVREDSIPAVFKIELSSGRLAETVSEETGAEVLTFYTGHNVSAEDFAAGMTYFDMMERNLEALRKALY